MRRVKILNQTGSDIVLSLTSSNVEVKVGESVVIQTDERYLRVKNVRVGADSSSLKVSEFPAALFKNRWVISLILCLCLDCVIDLSSAEKNITVRGSCFSFRDEILFSCLSVNSDFSAKYTFSKKSGKVKSIIFLAAISLLYLILSLFLTIAAGSLLFENFNAAYVAVFITAAVLAAGSVNHLIKSLNFFNIDSNFQKVLSDCTMVEILKCSKFFVKYYDGEKED